jgi:hypothetical protein
VPVRSRTAVRARHARADAQPVFLRGILIARDRRFIVVSLAAFLAAGILLYWRALGVPFLSDDWEFLLLVAKAKSIAVCFDLLVGRFVRPLVMLTYYAGYRALGLWPAPYHLAAIVLHSVNAWLLCLVTMTLDPARRRWPGVAAGLLFLAFAGHTEAITWVAGLADPFVALSLFAMLLAAGAAFESPRPLPMMIVAWGFLALALLGKESAVVVPAIVVAYGVARRAPLRRILLYVSAPIVIVAGFFVLRVAVYGNPTAAYGGLGGFSGTLFSHVRALLLRSFLPASQRVSDAWSAGLDIPMIAIGLALIVAGARRRTAALSFSVAGLVMALAPAVPLSISVATTESERMLYIPTAFGAIITVIVVDALVRRGWAKTTLLGVFIAAHAVLLQRMHDRWRAAGDEFDTVTRTILEAAREHHTAADGLTFVLSMPDNVRGAYVFRRGFAAALHFYAPDLEPRAASIVTVESQALQQAGDPAVARQAAPLEFTLDVSPNVFLSPQAPVRPFYTFPEWTRSNYRLRFTSAVGRGIVLAVSEGRAQFLADVNGPGAPFGSVDIPQDGAPCDSRLRFSGWALDDREVARVTATRDRTTADPVGDRPVAIADATWAVGTRPDVAAAYAGFPRTDRAEWNVELPCAILDALPGRSARVVISASDAEGHHTELGARTIHR